MLIKPCIIQNEIKNAPFINIYICYSLNRKDETCKAGKNKKTLLKLMDHFPCEYFDGVSDAWYAKPYPD